MTLIQNMGHGGLSEITVTFSDHKLLVTEVDANDPGRMTVMKVNEGLIGPSAQFTK